ncbi:glycoside hydrolase family 13 protein [Streptomyces sp. DSM 44915]|uniref:Glycoside hydrolase family 13 protein n=1 Tax=Streptomyces chisholmiae TaxID=3075540 RepID=A0ABU2JXZ4_9ACTN|nr:glycoside hydrolase family 13 protein [Streptomyces sp. DSM 44915]MDT0269822.1 glycoside hydrolase family 13 protein [Streptomyces sp. DSM 44915]
MPRTRIDQKSAAPWWRDAVIYQVYIRSFADGNGDGIGDLAGLRARLPYLKELGVDALWINPWYPSPMADGGYDVADYRNIDPVFGTLAEGEELIAEAHTFGMRVVLDLVPNHTSDQHRWFTEAVAAAAGSPERDRYVFRDGRGEDGGEPPNDWRSRFGGPAWTRVTEPDGTPGQWYLHLFAASQPDLNWSSREVRDEFESILRFWFDRGVDGFRIDVAHGLAKDPALPDLGIPADALFEHERHRAEHPHWDQDEVHEIYQSWRKIADSYAGDRLFVAEAHVRDDRLVNYLRQDELHTAFNFGYLKAAWEPTAMREVIERAVTTLATVDAPPTWVLSNHDVPRHVTRYGREDTQTHEHDAAAGPADLALGTRRARAAALLTLALPGSAYLYQGEELGLWEVEDLPVEVLADPTWERSAHTVRGRDGCRVPLPWSGLDEPFGFGPRGTEPWLPQPAEWKSLTAQSQSGIPWSMLELYRSALRLRREQPGFDSGTLRWLETTQKGVLAFERSPVLRCAVNFSGEPFPLPKNWGVLLASERITGGQLPPDTTVWLWGGGSGRF